MSAYKQATQTTRSAYATYVAATHRLRAAEAAADEAEAAVAAMHEHNACTEDILAAETSFAAWAYTYSVARAAQEQAWAEWEIAAEAERRAWRQPVA
jgi:hypothetical protein